MKQFGCAAVGPCMTPSPSRVPNDESPCVDGSDVPFQAGENVMEESEEVGDNE